MKSEFILSCESTVDMPYSYIHGRDIPILFYTYEVDGVVYTDDMGKDPDTLPTLYQKIDEGKVPSTSQVTYAQYFDFFEDLLTKGDVLHIAFGSGMTQSVFNAFAAAEELQKKYPERKIVVVDSLCSSSGYGLLVDMAADMRDSGSDLDEIAQWVTDNRNKMHHQFFSTNLTQYRRSGRVSGPAATIGTVLNICPLMRLNEKGCIIAYDKVRGKKKAIAATVETVMKHIQDGAAYKSKLCFCHSNCLELAKETRDALAEYLGELAAKAPIYDIGAIIASHCGPGTVAVFFLGDERVL